MCCEDVLWIYDQPELKVVTVVVMYDLLVVHDLYELDVILATFIAQHWNRPICLLCACWEPTRQTTGNRNNIRLITHRKTCSKI